MDSDLRWQNLQKRTNRVTHEERFSARRYSPGAQLKNRSFQMAELSRSYYSSSTNPLPAPDTRIAAWKNRLLLTKDRNLLLIAMVGLPARGKSIIAHKLCRYLRWRGDRVEVFNAGQRRRAAAKEVTSSKMKAATASTEKSSEEIKVSAGQNDRILVLSPESNKRLQLNGHADFFAASNMSAREKREQIARETLFALFEWYDEEPAMPAIGIFDATNSQLERRVWIQRVVTERYGDRASVVFLCAECDDEVVLENAMRTKVRNSPDFKGLSEEAAIADLKRRIKHYEEVYEPVTDAEKVSYIKVMNLSSKVQASNIFGRVSCVVLPFVLAVNTSNKPIFLTGLMPQPDPQYIEGLATWVGQRYRLALDQQQRRRERGGKEDEGRDRPELGFTCNGLKILTSTQPAAIAAAAAVQEAVESVAAAVAAAAASKGPGRQNNAPFTVSVSHVSALNPLLRESGQDDGDLPASLSANDLQATTTSNLHYKRDRSRSFDFHERAAYGESYADLVRRLEGCALEVEAAVDPVLVIAHESPCR